MTTLTTIDKKKIEKIEHFVDKRRKYTDSTEVLHVANIEHALLQKIKSLCTEVEVFSKEEMVQFATWLSERDIILTEVHGWEIPDDIGAMWCDDEQLMNEYLTTKDEYFTKPTI